MSRSIVVILGCIACIGGTRSIARNDAHSVIYLSVCVAVCQAQRWYMQNGWTNCRNVWGQARRTICWMVLLWLRFDTLCTSGFMLTSYLRIMARNRRCERPATQQGQQDLTPRQILKLTHQGTKPNRGRGLIASDWVFEDCPRYRIKTSMTKIFGLGLGLELHWPWRSMQLVIFVIGVNPQRQKSL